MFETFKKIVSFRSCCTSRNFSCYIAPEMIHAEVDCMISQAWRSEIEGYCQRELGYIVASLSGCKMPSCFIMSHGSAIVQPRARQRSDMTRHTFWRHQAWAYKVMLAWLSGNQRGVKLVQFFRCTRNPWNVIFKKSLL